MAMQVDVFSADPCHGCKFAVPRENPPMFARRYVCTNKKRIEDLLHKITGFLDDRRLNDAYSLLGEACSMNDRMEKFGWIEPDKSIAPFCYEKPPIGA